MLSKIKEALDRYVTKAEHAREIASLETKARLYERSYESVRSAWLSDDELEATMSAHMNEVRAIAMNESYKNGYVDGKTDALIEIAEQLSEQGIIVKAIKDYVKK